MLSDDDQQLLSASQEAELNLAIKDITNYESNLDNTRMKKAYEIREIIHEHYKEKTIQIIAGAHITGNVTINFPA